MGIKFRYEPVQQIGRLAYQIGQAKKAEQIMQRQEAVMMRAKELEQRQQLAEYKADLDMKAKQQAMDWELQKITMRSQNDFLLQEERNKAQYMRQLAKELREADEYDMAVKEVQRMQSDNEITPEEATQVLNKIKMKHLGYSGVMPRADKEQSAFDEYVDRLITEDSPTPAASQLPTSTKPVTMMAVNNQTGQTVKLEGTESEVNSALASGQFTPVSQQVTKQKTPKKPKHSPAGLKYRKAEAKKNPYYYFIHPSEAPGFK
jgi:tRNA U55 pseudouridine synthase TruB